MTSVADETKVGDFREVIRIDEGQLKGHVAEAVRQSVEETLNGLLEAEADAICGAQRYERSPERLDTRSGHYTRALLTQAGEVELRVPRLRKLKLSKAASIVREGVEETLSYMAFPREHWTRIRTNNMLERIMREIRRRTRVVGNFPDGRSALMLVSARLRHISGTKWGKRQYLDMERLREQDREEQFAESA